MGKRPEFTDDADARLVERARHCPDCGGSTNARASRQYALIGRKFVQWDITCPHCAATFTIDIRAYGEAVWSPFYRPEKPRGKRGG
jgi:ribosomal protein S27AE